MTLMGGSGAAALLFAANAATIVMLTVVAARLLHLAWRSREVPERAIGLSYLSSGCLATIAFAVCNWAEDGSPSTAFRALVAALLFTSLGSVALAVGVQRIFRPNQALAWLPAAATAVVSIGSCVALALVGSLETATPPSVVVLLSSASIYGWAAAESFALARTLRRRAAIGMASAEICARIQYWGWAGLSAAAAVLVGLSVEWVSRADGSLFLLLLQSLLLTACCVAMWCAFFAEFADPAATVAARAK